jgi:hypothetical protein
MVKNKEVSRLVGSYFVVDQYKLFNLLVKVRSGCSLKIHRVENQRCWWKAHIRKGLVCTVPSATFLIASTNIQFCMNEKFRVNLNAA